MLIVLTWYLALQLFALAVWPLAFGICDRLFDRGYGLSKGLGLLLITYITWVLAHAGEKVPALAFSFQTVSAAWFFVLAVSIITLFRNGRELWQYVRKNRRYLVTLELVMFLAFFAMAGFRAMVPHISYHSANSAAGNLIDHAAEKFTDFAILNSLLTSASFPPHDAWVSGETLNYYYFGHMLWATLIKFCSVRPEIGFNLALAGAFALCSALAFGLGYNLTRRLRWGFLTLFLIIFCSNLDGFLQLVTTLKTVFIDTAGQNPWYIEKPWWRNYEFWRTSRIIAGTINEFPAFSFILGDLHAHLSALVISLCGWHVAVQVFRSVRRYASLWRYEVNAFDELFLAALVCGGLSASNSWDVPLFIVVLALAMYCGHTGRRDPYAWEPPPRRLLVRAGEAIEALLVAGIVAMIGVGFLFYPFVKNFSSPDPGKEPLLALVMPENRSDPFEFFTQWFMLAVIPVFLVVTVLRRRRTAGSGSQQPDHIKTIALTLLVAAAMFALLPWFSGWVAITMFAGAIAGSLALVIFDMPPVFRWITGSLVLFCVMTCFCELVYLNDIFSGNIERINTVFKVYYGLWPLMAVMTILSLRIIGRLLPAKRRFGTAAWLTAGLLLLGSPYFILGSMNRINSSTRLGHWTPPADRPDAPPPSLLFSEQARPASLEEALDGMRYLKFLHPDDYAALLWVRAKLPADAILLEGAGSQYTYNGRFGTLTGRPTFAGWLTHAWGWRGARFGDIENPDNERDRRTNLTQAIYLEKDPETARQMLEREHIQYVILSDVEREQYPDLDEAKFARIATKVFERGRTAVYHLKPHGRE